MQTPKFLTLEEILWLHNDQIESFGGMHGVRDMGLLESALSQPQASFAGTLLHSTLAAQAAAYLYHLAMNHPFIDGNKRTAFAAMDSFLIANGYRLNLTDSEVYDVVIDVVTGKIDKTGLTEILTSAVAEQKG